MITIVVPTISKGPLRDSLQTVQDQSVGDWKLYVFGDGHIPTIYHEDESLWQDERIVFGGFPRTADPGLMRNKICRLVTTEWVGFLDDDDELNVDYVSMWQQNKDECDVLIYQMDNYGSLLPETGRHSLEFGHVGISFAVKTQLVVEHKFDANGNGEDYRFLQKMQDLGYTIKFLDWCGYYVRPYLNRGSNG